MPVPISPSPLIESVCSAAKEACEQVRKMHASQACPHLGDTEIYFHGGGFSGLWGVGILEIMHTLEEVGALQIKMLHGYSIGAIFAVCYACDMTTNDAICMYHQIQMACSTSGLVGAFRECIDSLLSHDAHERCTNKVRIGMTKKFPCLWYEQVSTFPTRDSLVDALVQSAAIPFFTASVRDVVRHCVDGAPGNVIWGWSPPRFGRTAIELCPPVVGYKYVFSPSDPYIYGLIIHGITDMIYYLQGKRTKYIRKLTWMPWHMGLYSTIIDKASWCLLTRVTDRPQVPPDYM